MMNYDVLSKEFDIVCKKQRLSLDWEKVTRTDCHLTEEHPQASEMFLLWNAIVFGSLCNVTVHSSY